MSDAAVFVQGWMVVLREAFEGGQPGQGAAFLNGTQRNGRGNHGLFATLAALTPEQASDDHASGTSAAAHAAHVAYHLEVSLRQVRGEFEPVDWPGSFEPRDVNEAEWEKVQARIHAAYKELVALAGVTTEWNVQSAGGMAAILAHTAYHLGAIRQVAKRAQA